MHIHPYLLLLHIMIVIVNVKMPICTCDRIAIAGTVTIIGDYRKISLFVRSYIRTRMYTAVCM